MVGVEPMTERQWSIPIMPSGLEEIDGIPTSSRGCFRNDLFTIKDDVENPDGTTMFFSDELPEWVVPFLDHWAGSTEWEVL